jgi:chromosome segregation ATPase
VSILSSWKESLETIKKDLEMTEKKKESLDDLLNKKRISRPTYEHLIRSLKENINYLKTNMNSLTLNIQKRKKQLERQIRIFEYFFAKLEIENLTSNYQDEKMIRENGSFLLGMKASKNELNHIDNTFKKHLIESLP